MGAQLDDLLGGLLGGKSGGLMSALVPMLAGLLAGGGLSKILGNLKANGLTSQPDSWVGTGPNEPVTGGDVKQAIGQEEIGAIAAQLGVSEEEVSDAIAEALPEMVDKVSPEGQLPPESDLDELFGKIGGQ